jgi:2'-hydroxyisoflavone reductase
MSTSRRKFLKLSAIAGGAIGLGVTPFASNLLKAGERAGKAAKPLKILILGGTGFTGPSARRIPASCPKKQSN